MFKLSLALSASVVLGDLTSYCNSLATTCFGTHDINATTCMTAMSAVTPGTITDTDVNTIGCREKYLTGDVMYTSLATACRFAGPSGGGRCGPMLSNTCEIATNVCVTQQPGVTAAYATAMACEANDGVGLAGYANQWGSYQGTNGASQNSLECRLYHAIASLSTGDNSHCTHYSLVSKYCTGKVLVDRQHYCETLEYNCGNGTGANAQFANKEECNATAAGYPNDAADDANVLNGGNNLGCREYHAQASAAGGAGPTHCEHAGPSGAGVCGLQFQAWGSILAAPPCNDPSVNMFLTMVGNVTANLAVPVGASAGGVNHVPYSTTYDISKNTQVCRIYHLGVASTSISHCPHGTVGGGNLCGDLVHNLCDFIGGICTFGTNATWQYASNAACVTALTNSASNNITVGPAGVNAVYSGATGDLAGNNLECRFYHASVAATFLPTGSQYMAPNAMENVHTHCSHTLQVAPAGGCGYVAMPTPAPAPKSSPAAALSVVASMVAVAVAVFAL